MVAEHQQLNEKPIKEDGDDHGGAVKVVRRLSR